VFKQLVVFNWMVNPSQGSGWHLPLPAVENGTADADIRHMQASPGFLPGRVKLT